MTRLKGLVATASLGTILFGVPWFLYSLGGGLPTAAPSAHQIHSFLGGPLTDNALLRGVSIVCWILWLLFLLALAAEVVARLRSRPGPSVSQKGFRIPGLQGVAGSLLVTALLLIPHRTPTLAVSNQVPASAAQPLGSALSQVPAPPPGYAPYTVQRYDTPWGIAEQHLGNGLRWREITDASGHTLATGIDNWVAVNGQMTDEPQARLIFPGQTLYLPAADPIKGPPPARPTHHPEPVASVPTPVEPPVELTPSTTIPAVGASASNGTPATHATGADRSNGIEMVGILTAGMVAGATVTTITRLRTVQSRHRRPGHRIRIPTGELATKEMALRAATRDDLIASTRAALRLLPVPAPIVHAAIANSSHVEVLIDRPVSAPAPWTVTGDGFRWRLDLDALPIDPPPGGDPLPALVPIGRLPGEGAEVMVNLESAGLVTVRGDEQRAAGLAAAAALALVGLPWATSADLLLVGLDANLAKTGTNVWSANTLEEVIDQLAKSAPDPAVERISRQSLSANGARPDGWQPTVILCATTPSPETLQRLESLCDARPDVSALVVDAGDATAAGLTLNVDSDPAFIPQLRLALQLSSATQEQVDAVAGIVGTALDLGGITVDDAPYADLTNSARPAQVTESAPVRILVLGVTDFVNVGDFRRPRSHETLLYLAMHPSGVNESQLDEKIWPNRLDVPASTRDPVISAVRASVGGVDRFPHATSQGPSKLYKLSNQVVTDWAIFCDRYRQGRQAKSVDTLRSALELVRGRPFGDLDAGPGYKWLHSEGHVIHMQAEIVDCADLAAGLFLEAGQPIDCRWAALRGLLADPYAERLWIRLMAAADALGEAQEIEKILQQMDVTLGLDGDYDSLHPDTLAAYRRYSRRLA